MDLPLTLKPGAELLLRQLQKRLAHEPSAGIEHCRSKAGAAMLLGDLLEGRFHAA